MCTLGLEAPERHRDLFVKSWLMLFSSRPQREHTDIEEELHELAHIDYDRVSIVSDLLILLSQTQD